MPESLSLDIDSLLLPIPGDKPAGDATAYPYRLREKLSDLRIEERAEDFDEATRPPQLKRADFASVIRLGTIALTKEAKDLRIACHLIEALTKTQGFIGLQQGLRLLKRLLSECWDRLEPNIDDGDLDSRASPIANLLDDSSRGFCFPNTVRAVPIVAGQSVLSWQRLYSKRDADTEQEIANTQAKANPAQVAAQKQAIDGTLAELDALCQVLDERLKDNSPGLTNLRKAIEEAQLMAGAFLPKTAPSPAPSYPNSDNVAPPHSAAAATSVDLGDFTQVVGARDEVYAQLTRAATMLAQLEPHSPIPYLVRRAVDLGKLPFPQLMQQLIREEHILADLQREFGLTAASPTTNVPA